MELQSLGPYFLTWLISTSYSSSLHGPFLIFRPLDICFSVSFSLHDTGVYMFLKMRKKRAFFLFLFFVIETIDLRKEWEVVGEESKLLREREEGEGGCGRKWNEWIRVSEKISLLYPGWFGLSYKLSRFDSVWTVQKFEPNPEPNLKFVGFFFLVRFFRLIFFPAFSVVRFFFNTPNCGCGNTFKSVTLFKEKCGCKIYGLNCEHYISN